MIINRELSPSRIGDPSQSEPSITAEPPSVIVEDQVNIETEKDEMADEVMLASSDFRVKHILDLMRDFDAETEHLMQETNAMNRGIRRTVCTIKGIEKNSDVACGTLGWDNPRSTMQVFRIGKVSSEAAWMGK